MELNNHKTNPSVFFQCLTDAVSGYVLVVAIDNHNNVTVETFEIKPTSET